MKMAAPARSSTLTLRHRHRIILLLHTIVQGWPMDRKKHQWKQWNIQWNSEKNKRTVPKKKRELSGTVLLLREKAARAAGLLLSILLLPYFLATFTGGMKPQEKKLYYTPITVIRHTGMGMEHIPLEEYLTGALAASMDPSYEMEALKAQAVVLRTMVQKQYKDGSNKNSGGVDAGMLQQEYMSPRQMQERFGENFEAYYEKLETAVEETQGCIILYENIAVDAPYFFLSSGKTRNGREVFGSADYPHLQPADSSADLQSEDYFCRYSYGKKQFAQKIEEMMQRYTDVKDGTPYREVRIKEMTLKRDSSGYVLAITIRGEVVPGEFFRNFFHLNSACLTIKEQNGIVEMETKGIGHGVGMSQYGANAMAASGADFMEILQHYFTNIEIQRN